MAMHPVSPWHIGEKTVNVTEKYRLIDSRVTLNGKPAKVCGAQLPWAFVVTLDSRLSAEYAWNTVQHVIDNLGGKFKA
jgi:hypothetical protein